MATNLDPCYIAKNHTSVCHKLTYSKTIGLVNISDLSLEQRNLIFARCGLQNTTVTENMTVCLHHKKLLLDKYKFLQKTCCDPFDIHTKAVKGSLRSILDTTRAESLSKDTQKDIKPGQKLCPRCMSMLGSTELIQEDSSCEDDGQEGQYTSYVPDEFSDLNESVTLLGCSPMKDSSVSQRDMVGYGKRKLDQAQQAFKQQLANKINVEPSLLANQDDTSCENCADHADLHKMINDMKEKCAISTKQKKLQILTMSPSSWSIKKTAEEFNVSEYMVKKARSLKQSHGVFSEPSPKHGKELSPETQKAVVEFYEDDEYTRLCPGKKEFVSVKIDGQKIHKQKRLLLANLHELYVLFKEKRPQAEYKIGFSKFCDLRPPWCITVGAKGAHSVCVCEIHQNAKLLLAAVTKLKLDYTELMSIIVCDLKSKDCMIHRCDLCPGVEMLRTHIQRLISEDLDMDDDDLITFRQWDHTDRITIVARHETVSDFITILCKQYDELTTHHFISKSQATYLANCKENLTENTVIILLDFAENYSFIIQDSIQGFYWENKQATLHPFGVYYLDNSGKLCCMSLCVISDCMAHGTVTVYAFLHDILKHIQNELPNVRHVKYYSDGAASQYKNFKNFANLGMHIEDFGVTAEWHFFATSHGKSICDGIGGTVKRLATRASLQRTSANHILTPLELYQWAAAHITGIQFFYVSNTEVDKFHPGQATRFASAKKVPGTRSHHCFIPIDKYNLKISRISGDNTATNVRISDINEEDDMPVGLDLHPGQYVAAFYDGEWFLGNVVEVEPEDILVDFLHPKGPAKSFSWPSRKDQCWVPKPHILASIDGLTTSTGRIYKLNAKSSKEVAHKFKLFCDTIVAT